MKDFFFSVKFKIIVCVAALLIGVMIYAGTQSGTDVGSVVFETIFSPIQELSTKLSDSVRKRLDMLVNADSTYNENEQLKQQLVEMYEVVIENDRLTRENEELRSIIGLKEEQPDYVLSPPCSVISRTANDPFGSFLIDCGYSDGISQYDPVITADGLVGVVTKVSGTYSRVQTILSPEVPVGVMCVRTRDTGVIEGTAELAAEGKCRMRYIDRESKLKSGDIIVTSGSSGLFPNNRIVGIVERIETEESGLSQIAIIKPVNEIKDITSVFVITDFNGQGEGYDD